MMICVSECFEHLARCYRMGRSVKCVKPLQFAGLDVPKVPGAHRKLTLSKLEAERARSLLNGSGGGLDHNDYISDHEVDRLA